MPDQHRRSARLTPARTSPVPPRESRTTVSQACLLLRRLRTQDARSSTLLLRLLAATVVASLLAASAPAEAATLMRYPSSGGGRIVFVARGELWSVLTGGGRALRLTYGGGEKLMPRVSPDGRWVAYTALNERDQAVYLIPASGGQPERLTFRSEGSSGTNAGINPDNLVVGWTPDSRAVLFLSHRAARNPWGYDLFQVPRAGGLPQRLPVEHPGLASLSPDGHQLAFASTFRDFDMRKRYDGGLAQKLRVFDVATGHVEQITDWKGTDTDPMWAGHKIYFVSDRDALRRANLWVYDEASRQSRQVTFFKNYDVDFPALGDGAITFQQGGQLWRLELVGEKLSRVRVEVPDDGQLTRPRIVQVGDLVKDASEFEFADYTLSPSGDASAFSARGDIFRVAADGNATNLTGPSGGSEEHPSWSPDGSKIAYVTDAGGERQVAIRSSNGGPETVLTRFARGYPFQPRWSPDCRLLLVPDASRNLWLVDIAKEEIRLVARDPQGEIMDGNFSPDSRWIAFSTQRANQQRGIHLYEVATRTDKVTSAPSESERLPAFSSDGTTLYFVSARHELLAASDEDDEFATFRSDGLYALALRKPDAVTALTVKAFQNASSLASPRPTLIDFDGLNNRISPLPVPASTIRSLQVRGNHLFYQTKPIALTNGDLPGEASELHDFDIGTAKGRVLLKDLDHHVISADGEKILYRLGGDWRILDLRAGGKDNVLPTSEMRSQISPRQEWAEMFDDAWRLERDLFWSPSMDGVDWPAARDAYRKLLPLAGSREDVTYIIGQMLGELASSHIFLFGGDAGRPTVAGSAPPLLLGADYAKDTSSGFYRFARIFRGDNTRPALRSPLTAPNAGVTEGDLLLSVDGKPVRADTNLYQAFDGSKGPLTIRVRMQSSGAEREVTVDPLNNEEALREEDWVLRNREQVDRASNGRVGYVFISDFHDYGVRQFIRQCKSQLDKEALIFDVRWNLGGNLSQIVLRRIGERLAGQFLNREGAQEPLPNRAAPALMVSLTNGFTASDGDQFAYYFRRYGLGRVYGGRTWGGVRGVADGWRLRDGARLSVPRSYLFSNESEWLIENYGVEPDVKVEECLVACGEQDDPQITAAVEALLRALPDHPSGPPPAPPYLPAYPARGNVVPAHFLETGNSRG